MNDTIQFLSKCSFDEFSDWFRGLCIDDSFKNIQDNIPFKIIMINETDYEDEKAYFNINYKNNLKELFYMIREYVNSEDQEDLFDLDDSTRFFVYSQNEQYTMSNHPYIVQLRTSDNLIITTEGTS